MKVAVLKTNDPWLSRMLTTGARSEFLGDQPVTAVVDVEQVDLLHHGPQSHFRPYLHVRGRVAEFLPVDESTVFPFDAESLEFGIGNGDPVDMFYEFDREQLVELTRRGYFTEGFSVPASMENVQWELPGRADITVIYPDSLDEDPVFFGGLRQSNDMELNQENSGYHLAPLFPEVSVEDEHGAVAREQFARTRREIENDIFSDLVVEMPDAVAARRAAAAAATRLESSVSKNQVPGEDASTVSPSLFEQLMARYGLDPESRSPSQHGALDASLTQMSQRARERAAAAAQHEAAVQEAEADIESEQEPAVGLEKDMFADMELGVHDTVPSPRPAPARESSSRTDTGPELG